MSGDTCESRGPARLGLLVLVLLVLISPWPFGCVHPLAVRLITVISLATALLAILAQQRGGVLVPDFPLWPVVVLLGVAALQLVPLPPPLHALVAPGSFQVWHPAEPAAAEVLGLAWRPISINPETTLRWLGFVGGLLALALVSSPALSEAGTCLRASGVVVAAGLAVAIYGVFARALFGPLLYGRIPVPTVSPFGPFVSKNHFAGYVEMCALLAAGLGLGLADHLRAQHCAGRWLDDPRAARVVVAFGACLAMVLAVLVSLSRGGVIALAVGGVAILLMRQFVRRRHRQPNPRPALAGLAGLCLLAITAVAVLPRDALERMRTLGEATREQSGSFRLDTWWNTLHLAGSSPWLGYGMGAFVRAFPRFKRAHGELLVEHAENDYLELLAEGGGVGLGLALGVGGWLATRTLRRLGTLRERKQRGVVIGALAGIVAVAVHGGFDFNLHIASNAVLATWLALAAVSLGGSGPRALSFPSSIAAALTMVVLLFVVSHLPLAHERNLSDVQSASRLHEPTALRLRLLRADDAQRSHLSLCPADAEAWLLLGWVRLSRGERTTGVGLLNHAAMLDPTRAELQRAVERLLGTHPLP